MSQRGKQAGRWTYESPVLGLGEVGPLWCLGSPDAVLLTFLTPHMGLPVGRKNQLSHLCRKSRAEMALKLFGAEACDGS